MQIVAGEHGLSISLQPPPQRRGAADASGVRVVIGRDAEGPTHDYLCAERKVFPRHRHLRGACIIKCERDFVKGTRLTDVEEAARGCRAAVELCQGAHAPDCAVVSVNREGTLATLKARGPLQNPQKFCPGLATKPCD